MEKKTELGTVPGYFGKSSGIAPRPGIIVIQEWRGLDEQTKSIADRFAGAGYLAFAPDLYHGELAAPGDSQTASSLVQKYAAGAPADLEMVYDAMKQLPDSSGRIGSVGFCFGGRMSLMLGIRRPLDAVCTFYGGGMQHIFDQMGTFKSPVLGLFGDQDTTIPAGTIQQFDLLLERIGVAHEIVIYPDAGHAFFRDSDPAVYKPAAAKDAWERVTQFFAKNLGGNGSK
jgi:carboxymethylenebutenolidase